MHSKYIKSCKEFNVCIRIFFYTRQTREKVLLITASNYTKKILYEYLYEIFTNDEFIIRLNKYLKFWSCK